MGREVGRTLEELGAENNPQNIVYEKKLGAGDGTTSKWEEENSSCG